MDRSAHEDESPRTQCNKVYMSRELVIARTAVGIS